jgi:hypothetical protein
MSGTVVVHVSEPHHVYIGRAGKGQDGYFGNPFKLARNEERGATIARYKRYFWDRINTDVEFRTRVAALDGATLGCFCKPHACHGDVIVAWLNAGCPVLEDPYAVAVITEERRLDGND